MADRIMRSRIPHEREAYMQMISRPLSEDTRHVAAAVVGMRDAHRSFEAEEVGQNTLKVGLREGEALYHRPPAPQARRAPHPSPNPV